MILTDATNLRVGTAQSLTAALLNATTTEFWVYLTTTISRVISGARDLIKYGSGTMVVTGANTFTGATTISGGTLQLGSGSTSGSLATSSAITNNGTLAFNRSNAVTQGTDFASVISGTGNLTQSGTGNLTLNGNNTFSGGVTLSSTGTLQLAHSNAAGNGTIFLKYASSSFVAKTLGISGGITVANAIQIDSTTGREAIVSSGTGNNSLTGGITITGAGANSILFSNEQSSGNLTVSGGISGASYASQLSLRGSQSGNVGFLNGAVTLAFNALFDNNGATNWTLNTASSTWGTTYVRSSGNLILGVNNALATGALLSFDQATSTGALDLNGYNQSVAAITSVAPTTGNGGRITNNGTSDSVLTLAGLAVNHIYYGTIVDGATNKISLQMNAPGRIQTFNRVNSYTGATTITAGTLRTTALISGPAGKFSQADFTNTTLTVTFSATTLAGENYRLFPGATTQTYASVTLVGAGAGRTAIYNSTNSTLTIA